MDNNTKFIILILLFAILGGVFISLGMLVYLVKSLGG